MNTRLRTVLVGLACVIASAAHAAPLRIASAFDPQTMDPHALALLYHTRVWTQVYESLVGRDEKFQLEPALALSWQATSPTSWRFKLRPGVAFHDGAAFTADDVVFSVERALAPPSQRGFQLKGVKAARKVDDLTVDFILDAPDAVLPEKVQGIATCPLLVSVASVMVDSLPASGAAPHCKDHGHQRPTSLKSPRSSASTPSPSRRPATAAIPIRAWRRSGRRRRRRTSRGPSAIA